MKGKSTKTISRDSAVEVGHGDKKRTTQEKPIPVITLCLLFCILFLPMLAIPLVLFGLVTWEKFDFPDKGTPELPVGNVPPNYNYYTLVSPAKFALVSSWASTVEGHVTAPFLILFSFLIAWRISRKHERHGVDGEKSRTHTEKQIRVLLQSRTFMKLWSWIKSVLPWGDHAAAPDEATLVTVVGLALTLLFTALIIAGDNWLHTTVQSQTGRFYDTVDFPVLNTSLTSDDDVSNPNSPLFPYAAGYKTAPVCDSFLNGSSSTPCSLAIAPFYNIYNASSAYLVLQEGISDTSLDFGGINITQALRDQQSYTASSDEVITYLDPATNSSHSFLFFVDATYQFSSGNVSNYGYDFVAPSLSMQTTCEPIVSNCGLENNSSLFNCSNLFSGNLSTDSRDGRIRIPGWDTFFYAIGSNGSAHELGLGEDQNPFHFNVTVQVDAISDILANVMNASHSADPNKITLPDPLVHTGNGSVGFAMSCTSTVYSVTYSVINETITSFRPTIADPKLAAIMRAPLQVGYGRYNLYQSALIAIVQAVATNGETLNSTLAKTFSQVGAALSSSSFVYTTNIQQRMRADVVVTAVPKAAVWFLATVCCLYAFVGIIIFIAALVVRKNDGVRDTQQRLGLENADTVVSKGATAYRGVAYKQVNGEA